jgi:hypothetical protein
MTNPTPPDPFIAYSPVSLEPVFSSGQGRFKDALQGVLKAHRVPERHVPARRIN